MHRSNCHTGLTTPSDRRKPPHRARDAPGRGGKKITRDMRIEIHYHRNRAGLSLTELSKLFDLPRSTIWHILSKPPTPQDNPSTPQARRGRPPTADTENFIEAVSKNEEYLRMPYNEVARRLDLKICKRTIRRAMQKEQHGRPITAQERTSCQPVIGTAGSLYGGR
ncbi:hypothetical protein M8818_000476 [Zalaria obscura]|uniref:Uncharacterized protein n=1 Tax=Zalaria obscura TaxID=2024903 RepID=A0ACC3SQI3_9PEZI